MATKAKVKAWRGVVLATKENVTIEAKDYEAAKREMKKRFGPEYNQGSRVANWVVGTTGA